MAACFAGFFLALRGLFFLAAFGVTTASQMRVRLMIIRKCPFPELLDRN
jgi:hypothetical protein